VVTIRSLCCGQHGVLCEAVVKMCRVVRIKLNQLVWQNVYVLLLFYAKCCHSSKHFSELASDHGGKPAGIDMEWKNYVTVTLCIGRSSFKFRSALLVLSRLRVSARKLSSSSSSLSSIYVKKLISLKHCVRSQITRLKLPKSFCDLEHGASLWI